MAESMADRDESGVELFRQLPLEDAVRAKIEKSKETNIAVIGCFHVGKSTLHCSSKKRGVTKKRLWGVQHWHHVQIKLLP